MQCITQGKNKKLKNFKWIKINKKLKNKKLVKIATESWSNQSYKMINIINISSGLLCRAHEKGGMLPSHLSLAHPWAGGKGVVVPPGGFLKWGWTASITPDSAASVWVLLGWSESERVSQVIQRCIRFCSQQQLCYKMWNSRPMAFLSAETGKEIGVCVQILHSCCIYWLTATLCGTRGIMRGKQRNCLPLAWVSCAP